MIGHWTLRNSAALGAVCTLLLGGMLTWLSVDKATANVHALAQARFDQNTRDLRDNVIARLTRPRYGLSGLRGAAAALGAMPNAVQFREAVLARDLPEEFPGVLGFGLVVPVERTGLPVFLARARVDYNGNFTLSTTGNSPDLFVIRSIEPLEANRAGLGFDIGSETNRREAAESAVRSGELAITAPVHLRQVRDKSWGAVYLLPAYVTDDAGRYNSIGLVFAAVSYQTSLLDLDKKNATLRFSLDDTEASSSTTVFSSHENAFASAAEPPHFRDTAALAFGGRRFALTMVSTPSFDAAEGDRWPWLLGILGSAISTLIALAAWLLIAGQSRALALAKQMTHDLHRLSMVGQRMQDAVLVTDAKGKVTWANPAFYRASRRPPKEVLFHPVTPFLGKLVDDAPEQQTSWASALSGRGSFRGLASRALPNGTLLWLETEIQSLRDPHDQPDGLVIIQSDITGRRVAELQLLESQSLLDRTGRVAGVGGWQLDLATQNIIWSAQTRRISEVPDDFVPSLANALAFFTDHARKELENAVQRSIASGKGWDLELPLVTYRAREIWVRCMGVVELNGRDKPVRLIGALQDITLRKHLEVDLQEHRELLRVTLSTISDAVVTSDPDGIVIWMNTVAERLSGWPTSEARGRPIADVLRLMSTETGLPVPSAITAALAEKSPPIRASNVILLAKDGTRCAVDNLAAPLSDAFGNILGWVVVLHDLSGRRTDQTTTT